MYNPCCRRGKRFQPGDGNRVVSKAVKREARPRIVHAVRDNMISKIVVKLIAVVILNGIPASVLAALTGNGATLFAVVREANPGAGDWIKVAEQDNFPVFQETENPPVSPWLWSVNEQPSGFTGVPSVAFIPLDEDGKTAELRWSGIVPGDWRLCAQATVEVTLIDDNGMGSHIRGPYIITLDLRSIEQIDFTVIEGQSDAGSNPVCAPPPGGGTYEWSAVGRSGVGIAFDPEGRISVDFCGDWSMTDEVFSLTLRDGSGRSPSVFDGSRSGSGSAFAGASRPTLKIRRLIGDGYTVFRGQESGGAGITGEETESYTFIVSDLPPGVDLSLGDRGEVLSAMAPDWTGASDGTFNLAIQDGRRPHSIFEGEKERRVSFRTLADGYTLFHGQVSGGNGVNTGGAHGFSFSATEEDIDLPGVKSPSLSFNEMGAVTTASLPRTAWNEDGSFLMVARDGDRPPSVIDVPLSLRRLAPVPLAIRNDGQDGVVRVSVEDDIRNWEWAADFSSFDSSLSAPDGTGVTLEVSWQAGSLVDEGETSAALVTLRPTDGSSPVASVAYPVVVEANVEPETESDSVVDGGTGTVETDEPEGTETATDSVVDTDTGTCEDGETRCVGSVLQQCQGGAFADSVDCAEEGKSCEQGDGGEQCVAEVDGGTPNPKPKKRCDCQTPGASSPSAVVTLLMLVWSLLSAVFA